MRNIWLLLIGLSLSSLAAATPWFTQDPRTLPEGKWRVEEHVLYAPVDDRLVDGDREPLTTVQDFSSLTLHTRVRYGWTDNVTVFADLPYVFRHATANGGAKLDNEAMGDVLVLVKR